MSSLEICKLVVSEVRCRKAGSVGSESSQHRHSSSAHLHLGVGPSWDLNDHVHDGLLLVGVERDIMEWRDWLAILLDVDAVL